MKKETYILSPDLKWSTFKKLWDSVPDSGPTPMHMGKMIWQLMREQKIAVGINTEINDFIFWSDNPPKGRQKNKLTYMKKIEQNNVSKLRARGKKLKSNLFYAQ